MVERQEEAIAAAAEVVYIKLWESYYIHIFGHSPSQARVGVSLDAPYGCLGECGPLREGLL